MRDCYAVYVIRHYNALPDIDNRNILLKVWHWINGKKYMTKKLFEEKYKPSLTWDIVENRDAWSDEDLGY